MRIAVVPRTRAAIAVATLSLALLAMDARALRAQDARVQTVPVLFSVSGGASMGTYQAGATWAIVRFMQLANADAALRPARNHNLRYRLGAISGTSAGNINALISSLEWCRRTPVRPEFSLYAGLWLNVGVGQLNPLNASPGAPGDQSGAPGFDDAGLISRDFFRTLWDTLTSAMSQRLWDPECNVPVGLSMTRIIPAMYPLQKTKDDEAMTASTQRFVARWRVEADSATLENGSAKIALRPPDKPKDGRIFGAEYLIDVGKDGSRRDTVDRGIVFKAVQASASVPLLWAAVPLPTPTDSTFAIRSTRGTHESGARLPAKKPKTSALFVDGGLFDADPLSLAIDLWSQERDANAQGLSHPVLIRVDQDDLRALLLETQLAQAAEAGPAKEPPPGGIEPVLTLLGGFLPSAREYELQSLGRQLAREATDATAPIIVHTTRAYPAAAEHFQEMSGFLGRPFRDHDFYLGIYDGLRFAAERLICADPTIPNGKASPAVCIDSVLTHLVIPAIERTLPDHQPLPLVSEFARCESGGWSDAACTFAPTVSNADPVLAARYRVVAALARQNQRLISYQPPPTDTSRAPRCGPRECDTVVAKLVWGDGFGGILRDLAADSGFRSAIATIRRLTKPACWDAAAAWGSSDPACPVDSFFVRFVNEPEPVLDYAFRWELRRLTQIEARQMTKSKTASRIATLGEMAYTAQAFPYRTSFFAPSSVPEIEPSHLGWNLVPHYVSASVAGRRGFELGWDFALRYWRDAHIGITAPISFWQRPAGGNTTSSQSVAAGVGVFHRPPPNLAWLAFQVAVQYPQQLSSRGSRSARSLSTELAWSPPGMSKLKLAYRTDGTISIGLADLPGILYWGWRFF